MNRIGVTAGASTPTQLTRGVIAAIEALPATEPDAATVPGS
jgi:4-hydroxy-3-methylbut-2-enyl diphosphate reductase IspH